jgi:hypothetical protein
LGATRRFSEGLVLQCGLGGAEGGFEGWFGAAGEVDGGELEARRWLRRTGAVREALRERGQVFVERVAEEPAVRGDVGDVVPLVRGATGLSRPAAEWPNVV